MDSVAAANGGKIISNYRSIDNNPFPGINYYRLKMVDVPGNFTYSQLVVIRLTGNKVPLLYPNPATTSVNILQGTDAIESLTLYDLMGRRLLHMDDVNKTTLLSISLSNLPKATYIIEIRTQNDIFRNKLLKR